MRATISSLAFAATRAIAQNRSAPFNLILRSLHSKLNGSALFSCHEGAAIEGLCVTTAFNPPFSTSTYNFNYSAQWNPDPALRYAGILTYELGGVNLSSPISLQTNPTSNVALSFFTPSLEDYITVGFDQNNLMYIIGYTDDTTTPVTYSAKPYYRWYVCTVMASYTYEILTWVYGPKRLENPSCYKVDVERVFT
ncbi:related to heatshock protein Hsp150 [Phialocephala subalpina]|uniref:Related to heatshock protein Hsp150 n=1 Tax=Phialocephala subalpina TaxID=576137 RepID=A0A1L7WU52_9HELO|nr:related to heatshock protein Hsp150 [Phialocephala subalpina]